MSLMLSYEELSQAWKKVRSNKGAPGIDGISVQDYEAGILENLLALHRMWCDGCLVTKAYKTFELEKKNGKKRKISVPTVEERIIHTAVAAKLVQLFEPEFEAISYGYRPNRSYIHAIQKVEQLRDEGYQTVIDADIHGYFDHIRHDMLAQTLRKYLPEDWVSPVLRLVIHHQEIDGNIQFGAAPGKGIPQGSPISPLLANIYLDSFDEEILDRGEQIIRYADDFVVLLKKKNQANASLQFISGYLETLGLHLNTEKTRVVNFNEGFTFLGVSFIDHVVVPMKEQTRKALTSAGKYALDLDDDNMEIIRDSEDEMLNQALWHTQLPASLRLLQSAILDDGSGVPVEPDEARLNTLSLNQIARLKMTYIHKQGAVVHKKGNRLTIWHEGKQLASLPSGTLDTLLCFGAVHLTQAVIRHCLEQDISVIWLSQAGQFLGCIQSPLSGDPRLTQAQIHSQACDDQRIQLARFFIKTKINNTLGVVRRLGKKSHRSGDTEKQLSRLRAKLPQQSTLASLRGTEGAAARVYFQWYRKQFEEQWHFKNRNRQPPKDPVNALLSFGYTLLFYNTEALIQGRGLLPYIGYLHGDQPRQPALALDMMESFRPWIVDELVWSLLHKSILTADDFVTGQACLLTKEGRRKFIRCFEQKMISQATHPLLKVKTDIRRLIDIQILELRNQLLSGQWSLTEIRYR